MLWNGESLFDLVTWTHFVMAVKTNIGSRRASKQFSWQTIVKTEYRLHAKLLRALSAILFGLFTSSDAVETHTSGNYSVVTEYMTICSFVVNRKYLRHFYLLFSNSYICSGQEIHLINNGLLRLCFFPMVYKCILFYLLLIQLPTV